MTIIPETANIFFFSRFYLFDRASKLIDIDLHLYEKLIL